MRKKVYKFVNIQARTLVIKLLYQLKYKIPWNHKGGYKISKIEIVKTSDSLIEPQKEVTVYCSPEFVKIIDIKNYHNIDYKKISSNEFVNTQTGEVKTVMDKTNNVRAISSLRKSFSRLSLMINCNFFGDKSEVFITLSYDYKVTEGKEINKDINSVWDSFQRKNKEKIPYRCLIIIEYNRYGNPHYHILLKRLDGQNLSIQELCQKFLWQKGSIDIRPLHTIDGLVEYLNPFNVKRKREQIHYYKRNMQIYRCYGHFDRPEKFRMTFQDALDLVKENNLRESKRKSYEIVEASRNSVINLITKINYTGGHVSGK